MKIPVKFKVDEKIDGDFWLAKTDLGEEVICQRLFHEEKGFNFITAVSLGKDGCVSLTLDHPIEWDHRTGIQKKQVMQEKDAYVRLNTGLFDLELCRGNAKGEGSSKWGLRHFKSVAEDRDLLASGNNAIGGFYGPFFTPDNGLINPAEHLIVDIQVMEEGPVLHQYRLSGSIPDGLKPELRGKRFTLDWSFYYDVPFFSRVYVVDHFVTTINGRSIVDKITVGDEFETGQGQLVFDRFDSYDGTWYRGGDPYANKLAAKVQEIIHDAVKRGTHYQEMKTLLKGDMRAVHWDLYWRLFSVWEQALSKEELQRYLRQIRTESFVLAELNNRPWQYSAQPVQVSRIAEQTIFAGPATKTAEFNTQTGQSMIWQTSVAAGAFQIVQRPESGWQNWGTNGENECPALPVGTLVHTAYGPYAHQWRQVADGLEALSSLIIQ